MESLPCLILIIVLVVAIIAILVRAANNQEADKNAMEQAHQDYQSGLARLKREPANADFKQQALQLGRIYANLTREQKGVTVFDEMALMNDINAATAGATAAKPIATVETRLQELDALRAKGVITDAEYAAKRQRLIDEM